MKLGIIQTRGLGDIVIAAPIAMYYIERGCEVYWPIDSEFIPSFEFAFPKIKFIGIDKHNTGDATKDYFYNSPLNELNKVSCDAIICLYSHLTGLNLGFDRVRDALTFDAYKYAIAKVPFKEKWNFHPKRNPIRESKLFETLSLLPTEKYIIKQETGSSFKADISSHIAEKNLRQITIEPLTDNIFDWLGVIESSQGLYLIDSVYSNIVEQMNIQINKSLYIRSPSPFTPILKNQWNYI